ncbi:MAG: VWA domain-containing protein [Phycisphaerales bacterium]|nr:MAG: VWA domain-containing protein [Phycisphaerales bacterium]
MDLRFASPGWLLLMLLAVPMGLLAWRWFTGMTGYRRASAIVLRVVLLGLIAAALAGAASVQRTERLAVMFVVDVSETVRRSGGVGSTSYLPRVRDWIGGALAERGPDDLAGIVIFDGRSFAVATPTRADVTGRSMDLRGSPGSDIESALRYAGALIPADAAGRLVLISDGNETRGDALSAAAQLSRAGSSGGVRTPIDVAPVRYTVDREVLVEGVETPPRAAEGATIPVRIVLRSTHEVTGTLRLLREGQAVDLSPGEAGSGRRVRLAEGRTVVRVEVPLEAGRIHRFESVFEPDPSPEGEPPSDTFADNNRAEAVTLTPGSGSVLVLDGVSRGDERGSGAVLSRALASSGVRVELRPPTDFPLDVLGLEAFDLIVLQNVAAEEIGSDGAARLAAYVREMGGGLVMVGGPDSFGAGAWRGTAVEPLLPVELALPERLVTPEAGVVFVIDRSGSMRARMGGSTRDLQTIANEAAALAVGSLDPQDLVGVIAHDIGYDVIQPLGPNTNPERTQQRTLGIVSGGGTNIGPALAEAGHQLLASDAKVKQIVVLSDGLSMGSEVLADQAEALFERGVRVTTIALGDMADTETLSAMAARGGGAYFAVTNPTVLPRVFLSAVRVLRQPMVREGLFEPVITDSGSALTAGLGDAPALGGLVLTQRREDPTVTDAMLAPTGEPLLSHWAAGLGQVVAFTSDAHDWGSRWLDWPGYADLWTRVVRLASRPPGGRGGELDLRAEEDGLHVRYEATDADGRPMDLLTVRGTIYGPDGRGQEIRLEQTGPGVYSARAPTSGAGTYVAVIRPSAAGESLPPVTGGASVASGQAARSLASNAALLEAIARESGGRVFELDAPSPEGLFDRRDVPPRLAMTPLWRTLLLWAVAVLLLDVGTRRVAWDRFLSKTYGGDWRASVAGSTADRSQQASATVGGLRSRRTGDDADGNEPGAVLGEGDAARIRDEAMARRRATRRAAREATPATETPTSTAPPAQKPAPDEPPKAAPTPKPPADEPGGLLAAKRRARERFERDD